MIFPAFVGPSYTARSTAVSDEECVNLFAEKVETPVGSATQKRVYYGTPGLKTFAALPESPTRGSIWAQGRCFVVSGTKLYELLSDGTYTDRGAVTSDGKAVSMAVSNIQIMIVSAGRAFCYTLASNALLDVTAQLVATPIKVRYSDTYFLVIFQNSNKFQFSDVLDGTTWPGINVNAVSVFSENIISIEVSHREVWIFGNRHAQPYQNTGSSSTFDVIPGALIEKGALATFGTVLLDNTVFWVDEDERGARSAWRASGYTPQRISTHAVEFALSKYANIADLVSYTYQDEGHLFWVLYVPGQDCTWVYDVAEDLWHKRASWVGGFWGPHWSWNHVYAFGKHLVGDWNSGKVYEMNLDFLDDDGTEIRALRQTSTLVNEMYWMYFKQLTIDFETGVGPNIPLTDGNGNPRPPQVAISWSDDRGKTWSNDHLESLGNLGEYRTRVILWRLGRSRYRIFRIVITDPVKRAIVGAYLDMNNG